MGVYSVAGYGVSKERALSNVRSQQLDPAAFVAHLISSFNDLGLQEPAAEDKTLGKHGDGRLEAVLGRLSSPAAGALAANEVNARV